jgi:hypothetical protein
LIRKVLLFAVLLLTINSVCGIGVSPSRIIANNMERGAHIERQIHITGASPGDEISIIPDGRIAGWINAVPDKTIFPQADSISVMLNINIPPDAANGNYTAVAAVQSRTGPDGQGATSMHVISGVNILVFVSVTGEEIKEYEITDFSISNIEESSPLYLFLSGDNTGNVVATPTNVELTVYDKHKKNKIFAANSSAANSLPAHSKSRITVRFDPGLEASEYWAHVRVFDGDNLIFDKEGVFEIVQKGGMHANGELVELVSQPSIIYGEPVKLTAFFQNTGETTVSANLNAEIYKSDRLVDVVTAQSTIPQSEKGSIIAYYTPKEKGYFTIRAYVAYAGKKTSVLERPLYVESKNIPTGAVIFNNEDKNTVVAKAAIIFAFIAAVVILAIALKKRKVLNNVHKKN